MSLFFPNFKIQSLNVVINSHKTGKKNQTFGWFTMVVALLNLSFQEKRKFQN